jgi:hypothetical protein
MSDNLKYLKLRVAKENSSFLYFILESNDSLSFYSTTKDSLKMSYRDVEIYYPEEFHPNLSETLRLLAQKFMIQEL